MSEINHDKIAREWAKRGFTCELWVDPPGQRWENFMHEADEVVLVVKGEMEFVIEGKVHHPEVGDELLIPAWAVHSSRNIGSCQAQWLYGYGIIH